MKLIKSFIKPTALAMAIALMGSFLWVTESQAQQGDSYVVVPSDRQTGPAECYDENDGFSATVYLDPNGGYQNSKGLNSLTIVSEASNPPSGYVSLDDYLDGENEKFSETAFFIIRDDGNGDCDETVDGVPATGCNYCTDDPKDPCYNPPPSGGIKLTALQTRQQ